MGQQGAIQQNAWHDKLIDLSELAEPYKAEYLPTVNLAAQYFNNVTKKRGYYLVPHKTACIPFHVWGDLVEEAGYKMSEAPKTWSAFWNWFKPMQAILRNKGHRGFYVMGPQITSTGPADGNNMFYGQILARGGIHVRRRVLHPVHGYFPGVRDLSSDLRPLDGSLPRVVPRTLAGPDL